MKRIQILLLFIFEGLLLANAGTTYRDKQGVMYMVTSNSEAYCYGARNYKTGAVKTGSLSIKSRVDLYDWNDETQKYDLYVGTYTVVGVGDPEEVLVGAFYGLSSISLPNTVKIIKTKAFLGCDKLTTITIPNKVKEIERQAFTQCTKLKKVYFTCNSKLETIWLWCFFRVYKPTFNKFPFNT